VKAAEVAVAEAEAGSQAAMTTYQNAMAGKVDDEGGAETLSLPEQVGHWEEKAREATSRLQQGANLVKHIRTELKDLAKTRAVAEKHESAGIKQLTSLERAVTMLEQDLAQVGFSADAESALKNKAHVLEAKIAPLRDATERMSAQLEARLAFDFAAPEKNFDRNRVKGLVARLITVAEPTAATALEITAGSKLYQVVVDTEQTGKLLLEKGKLKKRVTILPLNKLNARVTDGARVGRAKQIAGEKGGTAKLAIELVGYSEEVTKAIEHCFGSTIVCDRPDVAEAIAFHPQVRNKTVTLDGDTYDPSGTLTGGSKSNLGETLSRLQRLQADVASLDVLKGQLREVQTELRRMDKAATAAEALEAKLDIKRHELDMCRAKASQSNYAQAVAEITEKEEQLANIEKEAVTLKEAVTAANSELTRLRDLDKNIQQAREAALKELEKKMKKAQKETSTAKSALAAARKTRDLVAGEVVSVDKDKDAAECALVLLNEALLAAETTRQELVETLQGAQDEHSFARQQVSALQESLAELGKELQTLQSKRQAATKAANEASLEMKRLTHKLKQFDKDCREARQALKRLHANHPWIETESANFNVPGGAYDFANSDMKAAFAKLRELRADQEQVSKKINKKVMGMIEKAEAEYEELNRKRSVILKDKEKIQEVISELEHKKAQALQTTWVKVNRDFGSIFSTLLPGTNAKLEPLEGCTVADGLEVRVAFNNVWKDSLSELSGGQRSLLALSLILSLLLFKPAPMYILDEVDAALDLSHTQNIGLMLRSHFSASQFIVVSLKEGMFNNANVIFRTRFVDGISQVGRTVLGNKKQQQQVTNGGGDGDEGSKAKTKTKAGGRENSRVIAN